VFICVHPWPKSFFHRSLTVRRVGQAFWPAARLPPGVLVGQALSPAN